MRAGMRAVFATVDGAADRFGAVVVENEVGVSTGAGEPAFDPVPRLGDRRAHRVLGGWPVGIGRGAGDMPLPLQPLAQFIVGLPDMFAEDMPAGNFVLA